MLSTTNIQVMHELRHVKISHHTCILQCTYKHIVCWYFMLVSISDGKLDFKLWFYASYGFGQGLNIWHTLGQVLPAAVRGAFHQDPGGLSCYIRPCNVVSITYCDGISQTGKSFTHLTGPANQSYYTGVIYTYFCDI